jgi:exodeoxyribonuclease-3
MTAFLKHGYVDTFRHFHPEPNQYSWWSYRARAREKNIGWRIDYHLVNKDFMPRVKEAFILQDVTGSDHCPVGIRVE